MSARFQLVLEDVSGNIPILKFRDRESGVETPRFTFDAKNSPSYTTWDIRFEEETWSDAFESFFDKVVREKEYELIFENHRELQLDGEMLLKLISSMVWLSRIICSDSGFATSKKEEEEKNETTIPKKNTVVVIS